jgi:hypothetical protein
MDNKLDCEISRTAQVIVAIEPIALPIESAPAAAGVTRTRIFEAVAKGELTARKAGKATILEVSELRRWIQSLPTRGRPAEHAAA